MKKKITFITSNVGKVTSMRKYLSEIGYEVVRKELPMVEPQADTLEEVAIAKAKQAYEILKMPLVVQDSGFCIDALNNFPGPYTKYVVETIGVDGIIKIMENYEDRGCRFMQALTYVDENGSLITFTEDTEVGTIADTVDPYDHPDDWSSLWKIYIPEGYTTTLNHIIDKDDEKFHERKEKKAVFSQLAHWLKEK